jgi:hypothetical protein
MTGYRRLSVPLLVLVTACHGWGQDLSARARVDSLTYVLGDRIAVFVDLAHPPGVTFQSLLGDTVGGFAVLDRMPFTSEAPNRTTTGAILSRYEPGTFEVPPLSFLVSSPGDTSAVVIHTNPFRVEMRAVEVDTTGDIRDLKPVLWMPYTLAEILLALGVAALVAALAYAGWRYWKKRRTVGPEESAAVPARPAHVVALEALAALKEKRLWQQGRLKEYYSELTEILRRYLEHRFGLMALEETTEEILAGMRRAAINRALVEETEQLLCRADLVKFAKHTPGLPEHDRSFASVRAFVERTRPVAAPVEQAKEAAHGV